jgi:hypothetical protein
MAKQKSYRVYYSVPTSFGSNKESIRIFNSFSKANTYALKLVKELRKSAKETDDDESVIIENVNTGSIDRAWINEGEGRVAYYKGGF